MDARSCERRALAEREKKRERDTLCVCTRLCVRELSIIREGNGDWRRERADSARAKVKRETEKGTELLVVRNREKWGAGENTVSRVRIYFRAAARLSLFRGHHHKRIVLCTRVIAP